MKNYEIMNFFLGRRNPLSLVITSLFVTLFFFQSCQKSTNDENEPDPQINPTSIEGSENLGSGYDVFDNYAEVSRVKAAILDVDALNKDGLIEVKTLEQSVFTTTSGTTVEEYSNSLQISASLEGSYMFFSGAIETNFHQERYSSTTYSFATVKSLIQKTQLRLPIDMAAEELRPYLTETAKTKLNDPTVTPDYIFNIYGTHCLTGVILGGRLDYSVSAETSDLSAGKSIGVYAEASFSKGGVSVSGSSGVVTEEEYAQFLTSRQKIVKTYGGQSEFGQDIINKDEYDAWIGSIDDNTVFCNYTQHGLVPVWDFCDNIVRKNELLTAYETWANDREIIVNPPEPKLCILDINVQFGANVADPLLIEGREYFRLPADLNASVGGAYIWIYYLLGYDNDETFTPLSEICTIDQTDGETLAALPGEGWVQLVGDLNSGAGGDYITLAYRRSSYPADKLLTGLRVEHIAKSNNYFTQYTSELNSWYAVTQGYGGTLKQDLNEGSGGWTIYLYYTYDDLIIK